MKRFIAPALVLLVASVSYAEITVIKTATASSEKVCDAKCADACKDGCPIQAAMDELPKFTYQVGTEKTCCSEAAAKLAKEHDAPIQFVVAEKAYKTKDIAMVALADATDKYVKAFVSPKTCEVSGKTSVAGKSLCCEVMASERAKIAKDAMAKVTMTYLVGEKECHCPTEATTLAKSTGAEKLFVVGKEKTCCSTSARLTLARAKYKAAIEALAKVDAVEKQADNS